MPLRELSSIAQGLVNRHATGGLAALDEHERVFFLVWCFAGQVDNGGFVSFFYNSAGEYAEETTEALRQAGSPLSAELLERAIDMFPDRSVPRELEARNAVVNALPSDAAPFLDSLDYQYFASESAHIYARLLRYWSGRHAA